MGRKAMIDIEQVRELRENGMGASAIAWEMGKGRVSVNRVLG